MGSTWIIGALAFVTIGLVIAIAIYHFGYFLKDPRNRAHAHNALVGDGESATSRARKGDGPAHAEGKTLKERLDGADASAHPADPEQVSTR